MMKRTRVVLLQAFICLLSINFLTAQTYDLLLKGGHLIDPKNEIDSRRDVAIANGKVAEVSTDIDAFRRRTSRTAGIVRN